MAFPRTRPSPGSRRRLVGAGVIAALTALGLSGCTGAGPRPSGSAAQLAQQRTKLARDGRQQKRQRMSN
jgi:hypothetical protein